MNGTFRNDFATSAINAEQSASPRSLLTKYGKACTGINSPPDLIAATLPQRVSHGPAYRTYRCHRHAWQQTHRTPSLLTPLAAAAVAQPARMQRRRVGLGLQDHKRDVVARHVSLKGAAGSALGRAADDIVDVHLAARADAQLAP